MLVETNRETDCLSACWTEQALFIFCVFFFLIIQKWPQSYYATLQFCPSNLHPTSPTRQSPPPPPNLVLESQSPLTAPTLRGSAHIKRPVTALMTKPPLLGLFSPLPLSLSLFFSPPLEIHQRQEKRKWCVAQGGKRSLASDEASHRSSQIDPNAVLQKPFPSHSDWM